MEYNLCYDIDYKCVFDVDRVVFWATRIKDVSHRKHRVRLLYPALATVVQRLNVETNVGMAVFIAGITSMCGFGLDGAAALLSAILLSCPAYVVHVSLPYSFHTAF